MLNHFKVRSWRNDWETTRTWYPAFRHKVFSIDNVLLKVHLYVAIGHCRLSLCLNTSWVSKVLSFSTDIKHLHPRPRDMYKTYCSIEYCILGLTCTTNQGFRYECKQLGRSLYSRPLENAFIRADTLSPLHLQMFCSTKGIGTLHTNSCA